jgi:molybdenum cofactor cytidylyltransferase
MRNVAAVTQTGGMNEAGAGVVAIVLAAGEGSRFGGVTSASGAVIHKLDATIDGRTLFERAVGAAVASGIGPVLVVVAGEDRHVGDEAIRVVNHAWKSGSASSLQAGISAARHLGARRAVIALGDQPFIAPEAWRAVASVDVPIAVATYAGRRGHPVQLRSDVWALLPTTGDEGAKTVMRLRPDLVREVPCQGSSVDIDTVEDLRRWENSSSTSSPSTDRSTRPGR